MTFAVTWPGSDLDLAITTPSGKKLTPSSPEVLVYKEEATAEYYVVVSDEQGDWTVDVTGVEVNEGGEPYELSVVTVDGAELIEKLTEDTDKDGLPDIWEVSFFGDLSKDGTGDEDGDGVSNLQELERGIDPTNKEVKDNRTAHGTLCDDQGAPVAGVTIDIDGKTTTTDALGNWEINGLVDETTYQVTARKDDYTFAPTTVDIGNKTMMKEVTRAPLTTLKLMAKPSTWGPIG